VELKCSGRAGRRCRANGRGNGEVAGSIVFADQSVFGLSVQEIVLAREELFAETRTEFPEVLLKRCWDRITLTPEIASDVLKQSVSDAQAAGFLRDAPAMTGLIAKP